jgi:hypothetical protein
MADIEVKAIGKSDAEIAHQMAHEILFSLEKKKWETITRAEYLMAHAEAILALRGNRPK